MQMKECEAYESVKRYIKKTIESIRAKSPEAAEYLENEKIGDAPITGATRQLVPFG